VSYPVSREHEHGTGHERRQNAEIRSLLVVGILFHIGGRKIPGKPIASSGRDTGDTIGNPMLIQPKAEFVNLSAVC
jgi:hypothetical protein